jgi:DNA-binding NarL/FixJ family response regulator
MSTYPRLLLADDHTETRRQLRALLEPEFEVVAEVPDGEALVTAAARLTPDVIVTDIMMPGMDGIAAATVIHRRSPDIAIVLITVDGDLALVERGLAAGALGYVLKRAAGEDLLTAVHAALDGHQYVSQALHHHLHNCSIHEE